MHFFLRQGVRSVDEEKTVIELIIFEKGRVSLIFMRQCHLQSIHLVADELGCSCKVYDMDVPRRTHLPCPFPTVRLL